MPALSTILDHRLNEVRARPPLLDADDRVARKLFSQLLVQVQLSAFSELSRRILCDLTLELREPSFELLPICEGLGLLGIDCLEGGFVQRVALLPQPVFENAVVTRP